MLPIFPAFLTYFVERQCGILDLKEFSHLSFHMMALLECFVLFPLFMFCFFSFSLYFLGLFVYIDLFFVLGSFSLIFTSFLFLIFSFP